MEAKTSSADRVVIRGLKARGILGIHAWEREQAQEVVIDIDLQLDTRRAALTDRLEDTLDYSALSEAAVRHVEVSGCRLVERLAAEIARLAIVDFNADGVRVRIEKTEALTAAASVGVEIERTRADFA